MSLYRAVELASHQPQSVRPDNARVGAEYYLFGPGGSRACADAAAFYGVAAAPHGSHCLLAGPATSIASLETGLPRDVTRRDGEMLEVKQGTIIMGAEPSNFASPPDPADPATQFYVLGDHAALFGNTITNPRASADTAGTPDVTFGFNAHGARAFQTVTAAVAHRGLRDSGLSVPLLQHFAVALDNLLITVPSIDFRSYPDGVDGSAGAQITGGFTRQSAKDLAIQLREGTLPLALKPISASDR
jgi:preprotein translocase subunit SecD